jgi:uncharacterized membrane protein/mono/diheme cytochrome c family protein
MILLDLNDWFILLGRTHPLIVHLPIGIVVMAFVLEVLALFKRFKSITPTILILWIAGALTATVACVAGYVLSLEGAHEENLLIVHQWFGIALAVVTIVIVLIKIYFSESTGLLRVCYVLSIMLLSVTGHFGGSMTHGEEFLNEPMSAILGKEIEEEVKFVKRDIPDIEKAVVYRDLVEPVLQEKCVKCHNPRKSKGKLRLDGYEMLVKGGKSGSTLVNGEPLQSELYKRLLLSVDDKKKMPPKGKAQLTKEEIEIIHWWIKEAEASEEKMVQEVTRGDQIKHVLAAYKKEPDVHLIREVEFPETKVAEPSGDAIKDLETTGVIVTRLAPAYPFLTINCVNAPDFGDKQTELLLPLKDQIVWLKGGETRITDAGLINISKLTNLTRLSLENTLVSDEGISTLRALSFLQYLNLVNTQVSDRSLTSIASVKKLKAVYLWKTKFTKQGIDELRSRKPSAEINFGEVNY